MSIRTKYIIFVAVLHLILVILAFELLQDRLFLFLPVEFLIIVSLFFAYKIYQAFIRPLNLIADGVKTLKDKDFSTKFIKVGQRDMDHLIDVYNKMIDTLRQERVKQREQHYFLEKLIQASPTGVILLDYDEKITSMNPSAAKILGTKETDVNNLKIGELEGKISDELARLTANEWNTIKLSGIHTYKCQKSHFMDRGFQRYFILIQEITEEIVKSEREAYEKVIRMMSHEINNSIGAVNSILNSFLSYKEYLPGEHADTYERALRVAIERNTRLNKFMKSLADVVRIPPPQKEKYDVHNILKSVHLLSETELERREIEWGWDLYNGSLIVELDVQQIEQAIFNIVKNSIEAIGSSGKITVVTRNNTCKELIIRDNGCGISSAVQSKIFSPFFSTRPQGKGIGLTLIREILREHGFGFALESTPDGYTEFRITLSE